MVFHVVQYAAQGGAAISPVLAGLARFETVDVLFLMSAYLLTLSYARAALDGPRPSRPGSSCSGGRCGSCRCTGSA